MAILSWYEFFEKIPFIGRYLFGWAIALSSTYTASIPYYVQHLASGNSQLTMRDSYFIHNPFSCIHAAALINLGEAAGGLAMLCWLESQPVKYRGIVTKLEAVYYKKVCVCSLKNIRVHYN